MASQFPSRIVGARDIGRFDPFDDLNRLFGTFFPVAGSLMGVPARAADLASLPRLDVQEDAQAIRVSAELPGVNPADVEVRIEGDTLVISGEKKSGQTTGADGYHLMERSFGHFKRAITLPFTPDAQAVDADFDLGVLTVRVPKLARQEGSHRVQVRHASGSGSEANAPRTYLQDAQRMPAGPDSEGPPQGGGEPAAH